MIVCKTLRTCRLLKFHILECPQIFPAQILRGLGALCLQFFHAPFFALLFISSTVWAQGSSGYLFLSEGVVMDFQQIECDSLSDFESRKYKAGQSVSLYQ